MDSQKFKKFAKIEQKASPIFNTNYRWLNLLIFKYNLVSKIQISKEIVQFASCKNWIQIRNWK